MLRTKGYWNSTIFWVTSDNGGMPAWGPPQAEASAASNFPLRGGKATLFEGGVRGVTFVTGGSPLLPPAASGSVRKGLEHLMQHVDVPYTMAALAGASSHLTSGGDGHDCWDMITTGAASPRTEAALNVDVSNGKNWSALIQGRWKLMNGLGKKRYDGWWSNDPYTHTRPDASAESIAMNGEQVLLIDLFVDEEERLNVAAENPDQVLRMQRRIMELADPANGYVPPQPGGKQPGSDPSLHNNTWAPWQDYNSTR